MSKTAKIEFETAFARFITYEMLGEGGAGRVYGATDENGTLVAIKELKAEVGDSDRAKRFKNEIDFLSKTKHANIVPLLDHGYRRQGTKKSIFYVMPRFSGNLAHATKAGVPKNQVIRIFSAIMDGVEAAHLKGVVHRDLKPENVLCDEECKRIVVADFGIARFVAEKLTAVQTTAQQRLANFHYCAPEQKQRGREVGVPADIYALGLILNELFTGEVPQGSHFRRIAEASNDHAFLDDIVEQMIRQDPTARPGSIEAVKQLIRKYEFDAISRQRLSHLSQSVVKDSHIDDPLATDPPKITSVRWEDDVLQITLDKVVHDKWVDALYNMGNYTAVMGREPRKFRFNGNIALISSTESEAQRIIDHFKEWLPRATYMLRYTLEQENERRLALERQRLETARKAEETKLRVNSTLRF